MKSKNQRSSINSQIPKMPFFSIFFFCGGNVSHHDSFLPKDPTLASFAHTGKQKARALIRVLFFG